ncbi:uncharacterized protein BYT42DRAFT_617456 [Radiomyces spectabilis]|uniref:uncharacterized protein n=1 Tax=Radiomyces spectabilis TaxID=64574 RepID=UPI002220DAD1|nr:uncharacterized protein BYT42DRAFT_617456 [Radiomyces spectabilis]KAI8369432.1 hypothetical protein BYT42DRAFT_617456 [Radiomyces spectabilis]
MSGYPSPTLDRKLRSFSPIILFHDHEYLDNGSGHHEHIHIPYGDPHYVPFIESHKKRIHQMLENNGRFWTDVMTSSRVEEHADRLSPVPSLVSSPTPPLARDLPSPQRLSTTPPPMAQHIPKGKYARTLRSTRISASTSTPSPAAGRSEMVIVAGRKRRRGNLPKAVTAILRDWLAKHKKHPYPTEEEKAALARQTDLTLNQISNWFINARRRILHAMLDEEGLTHCRKQK